MILISPAALERLKNKYKQGNATTMTKLKEKGGDEWLKQRNLLNLLSLANRRKPSLARNIHQRKNLQDPINSVIRIHDFSEENDGGEDGSSTISTELYDDDGTLSFEEDYGDELNLKDESGAFGHLDSGMRTYQRMN